MNFSFAFSVLIRRGDDRSGFIVAYSKIPRNRGVEIGYGGTVSGTGFCARHIPAAHRKTRFSQAWQPSRCICRFYDKRKVEGGGGSPVGERSAIANRRLPLSPLISPP